MSTSVALAWSAAVWILCVALITVGLALMGAGEPGKDGKPGKDDGWVGLAVLVGASILTFAIVAPILAAVGIS